MIQIKDILFEDPEFISISKKAKELLNESMFPKDFDRHALGSCMSAAAMATDYLLSKGRSDFKVVEGWVSLYPDQEEEDFSPHTWIQFNNGKIFDPTKKQWAKWGFDPNEVRFESIKKTYTPKEYQSVCQRQPDDVSRFKKMAEATMVKESESTLKMYHGGSRWSYLPSDIQPGKKNRYEAGVGIYFTNSYNTARKYAKGNKVVHLVEMEEHNGSTISIRIIKATEFFKNKLNIDKTPVKVNVISLTKDDGEIRYDFNINSYVINISSNVNEDRQIRALAHELTHLQQIVSGRLDYKNRKWLGKSYVGIDYKIQPWESEARTSAAELWVEFNRSVRDGKIKL